MKCPGGKRIRPAKTSPASWDAFSDVEAFVDAVLTELESMAADGTRPTRSGPKPPLTGAALRKAIMAIWCVGFCGLQWRAIGLLCDCQRRMKFRQLGRSKKPQFGRAVISRQGDRNSCLWAGDRGAGRTAAGVRAV